MVVNNIKKKMGLSLHIMKSIFSIWNSKKMVYGTIETRDYHLQALPFAIIKMEEKHGALDYRMVKPSDGLKNGTRMEIPLGPVSRFSKPNRNEEKQRLT